MDFIKNREAQGATEYLLMLAAVLVVVGVAVYFVMGTTPSFMVTAETGYPEASGTDVTFVAKTTTPDSFTADWVRVYDNTGTQIGIVNDVSITAGETVSVSCSAPVPADSELRIKYEGNTEVFQIS